MLPERLLPFADPQEVLGGGFVRLVDVMGDDGAVVDAARVSYQTGTSKKRNTRGLIRYLLRHQHTSPFEMCEIKLHVKLPIFVSRQWIRHRTASVNEVSARYSVLPNEVWVPPLERIQAQSSSNKQGSGDPLSEDIARDVLEVMHNGSSAAMSAYAESLSHGVSREIARVTMPVNTYTEWYWKIDVNNLLRFLKLRLDHHAQEEIRVYAEKIFDILKVWMPHTADAFEDFMYYSESFSRPELKALCAFISNGISEQMLENCEWLSKGELAEFKAKLSRISDF